MADASLATSADYADAMLVARRAKNWLFLLLLLMLLLQMTFFFVARYTRALDVFPAAPAASATLELTPPTTEPTTMASTSMAGTLVPTAARVHRSGSVELLRYISGFTLFLGTVLPILLALVLLLIVNIMLIGRLIGVSRVTSAFLWCLLLMLLMFPWQLFFGGSTNPRDFRIPGVLYTWNDLTANAHFSGGDPYVAVVKWSRFFVMPLVAAVILLTIQIKSNRGLKQALGEAPPLAPAGNDLNITV